jgi:pyridoxamine 5'-phosphate oxidase
MQRPLFYDDLDLSFSKAWDLIEPGARKRTSPAHTPVVATIDARGHPQARIMVLREADRLTRRLRFHTDIRTSKCAEIGTNGTASVMMYDPEEKLQLRLSGLATVQTIGEMVDFAWRNSTPFARRCYMVQSAPGEPAAEPTSGLPEWIEGKQPTEEQLVEARANFAILWFDVQVIEWLYLANTGHRRAKWMWLEEGTRWSGQWLVP